jgi:hypothetical protein
MVDRQAWDGVGPYRAETLADTDVGGTSPRHRGAGEARPNGGGYAERPPRHLQPDWHPRPQEPPPYDPGVDPRVDPRFDPRHDGWQVPRRQPRHDARWDTRLDGGERAAFRLQDGAFVPDRQRIPPDRPSSPRRTRTRRLDASRWHWLLLLPIVVPLFPPLYNRVEPTLGGVPFFYWGQLSFALLASAVVTIVHLATKPKGR